MNEATEPVIQSQEWPRVTKVSTGEMMLVMGEAEVTRGKRGNPWG